MTDDDLVLIASETSGLTLSITGGGDASWQNRLDAFKWRPSSSPCSVQWTKNYAYWDLSDYNKLEFWLWVEPECDNEPDDPETIDVVLLYDNNGYTIDGFRATVTLDYVDYFKHIIIYFGYDYDCSNNECFTQDAGVADYDRIKGIRFESSGDVDDLKVRISDIKVSSDTWLWEDTNDGFELSEIPTNIKTEVNNKEWGKAYNMLMNCTNGQITSHMQGKEFIMALTASLFYRCSRL